MTPLNDIATREILLSFWKVHILHHAEERPVYGQWVADELRRHGYKISPGTLYPLLKRMEKHGWLKRNQSRSVGPRARREYRLAKEGIRILSLIREQVTELHGEVVLESKKRRRR